VKWGRISNLPLLKIRRNLKRRSKMSQETEDFWEGYDAALGLLSIEVDKILSVCYNDVRTKDSLLDVKGAIKTLKEMTPHGEPIM
jgi:hypothetical protein